MAEAAWKPVAAGLLVVAAVAMVGRNLVAPHLGKDGPPAAESAAAPVPPTETGKGGVDTVAATPADTMTESVQVAESSDTSFLSGWIADPGRDPFGTDGRRGSASKPRARGGSPADAPAGNRATRHKLTAIAWGPGKLALVDGIAVGIGDSLPDGRVVDIGSDRLVLRRGSSDTLLRFWEGRKQ